MAYLLLGTIIGTHGLNGTLKFISSSYFLEERLQSGNKVYIGKDENNLTEYTVDGFSLAAKNVLLKLDGLDSIEDADKFKGLLIFVVKEELELEEGTYYFSDLEKCNVYDEDNNLLGQVNKVEEFPAQITLRVRRKNGKEFFVPFIDQFILSVDIKSKTIKIRVIGGML